MSMVVFVVVGCAKGVCPADNLHSCIRVVLAQRVAVRCVNPVGRIIVGAVALEILFSVVGSGSARAFIVSIARPKRIKFGDKRS